MKEAIRKYIVEKSEEIFKRKGYENTTVDEIAEASDVSKPTLYKYFKSKKDIFRAVVNNLNTRIDEEITTLLETQENFKDTIVSLISNSINYAMKNKPLIRIAMFEAPFKLKKDKNEIFKNFLSKRAKRLDVLIKILKKAKEKDEINENYDIDILALILVGTIKEIIFRIVFEDLKIKNPQQIAIKIYTIFIDGAGR